MEEREIDRAVAFLRDQPAQDDRGSHDPAATQAAPETASADEPQEATAATTGAEVTASQDRQVSPERMAEVQELGEKVIAVLRTIHDPEIPVNVFDMGLIYRVDIEDDNTVTIDMTLTTPHCPVAETLPVEVEQRVAAIEGVKGCRVNIVWDPPWHPGMMSEEARLELGFLY